MTTASQTPPPDEDTPPPPATAPVAQAASMTRTYDGLTVEAIAQGAVTQAQVETRTELTRARQEHESLVWLRGRWTAAATLCEGRPLDHLLSVHEVLTALDGWKPATMPLTMAWDGQITDPDGDGPGEATLLPCTTSRGGNAVIALTPEERLTLSAQLLATLHSAESCTRSGCGATAEELDGSGPPLFGWIRVQVAGIDGPPRWWCSPTCVNAAFAAAAAVDPDEQAPDQLYGGDLAQWAAAQDSPEYLDAEYGIGASDERGDVKDGAR